MAYQDDPNFKRRPAMDADTSFNSWIVGGLLALMVIAGLFLMFGRSENTSTASNTPSNRPAATAPASAPAPAPGTTGAGSTTPRPTAR